MNINLKNLFDDQTQIPELSNGIIDELKDFGQCQYVKYMDGGYQLNLISDTDLTEAQLAQVKTIIQNHDVLNYYKQQKINELRQNTETAVLAKYPLYVQSNVALGIYDNTFNQQVKTDITNIRQKVLDLEATIQGKKKKETLDAVNITVEV